MKQLNVTVPKIKVNVPKFNMTSVKEHVNLPKAKMIKVDLSKMKMPEVKLPLEQLDSIKKSFNIAGKGFMKLFDTREKRAGFLEEAESILQTLPVAKEFTYIPAMISMLDDYNHGVYPHVRKWAVVIAYVSLAYTILPIDLIPDSIPVLGKLDDKTLLALTWIFVKDDIRNYQRWQRTNHMMVYA